MKDKKDWTKRRIILMTTQTLQACVHNLGFFRPDHTLFLLPLRSNLLVGRYATDFGVVAIGKQPSALGEYVMLRQWVVWSMSERVVQRKKRR